MILLSLLLLAPGLVQEPSSDAGRLAELRVALAEAVDLLDPAARGKAATTLARRKDVSLEDWLAAAASFTPAPGAPDGVGAHSVSVELPVLEQTEATTLHFYVPASRDLARPAPLMFALHGAGGNGSQMLSEWQATAEALGMIVCAPTDPQADGGYAFTPRERAAALAALRWARRHYDVDENRIHLSGSSRGGHLAWDLAVRYPDLWASVSPRIGGPTFVVSGGRNNLRYVENVAHLPLRDLQGSDDDPKLLINLRLAFERLRAVGAADAQLIEQAGIGHGYRHDEVDWAAFLGSAVRAPFPTRIRLRAAWELPARAAWMEITRYRKEVKETFEVRVDGAQWDAWDHEQRVRHMLQLADACTASVRIERDAEGKIRLSGEGVGVVRLLLPAEFAPPTGRVSVTLEDKEKKLVLRRSTGVMLADFVERFDRSFLPVADVEIRL